MAHIRQIQVNETDTYTVVVTEGYSDLTSHPSIVEHPEIFEITNDDLPTEYQLLNYI